MALFGKTDSHVSEMVAFYQVEVDKDPIGGELDVLMRRYFVHPDDFKDETKKKPYTLSAAGIRYAHLPDSHTFQLWSAGQDAQIAAADLLNLGRKQILVKRIMDHLADKTMPSWEDIASFNKLVQKVTSPSVVWVYGEDDETIAAVGYDKGGPYLRYLSNAAPNQRTEVDDFLSKVISDLLLFVQSEFFGFLRCGECQSVFGATRRNAKWCSERCRIRNSERRRRVKKIVSASN